MADDTTPGKGERSDGDRGTVTVEVEISEALHELIREEIEHEGEQIGRSVVGPPESVGEWIRNVVAYRLRRFHEQKAVPVEVEIPPEAARRARLWAEDSRVMHGSDQTVKQVVHDFMMLQFRFPEE